MKIFSKFSLLALLVIFTVLSSVSAQADQVVAGSTVMLSVTADGTSPFAYQWLKNGGNLSGSTGPTLTLTNIQSSNAGDYSVAVSNTAGSTTSPISTITIAVLPVITTQPQSQSVNAGANVTFTAAASGAPASTFQWNKNGVAINGATSATLTLSSVQASASATYTVVATNNAGSVTSAGGVLSVSASQTAILSNAISYKTTTFPMTVGAGSAVNFSYNVTNTGTKTWGANHYLSLRDAQNNYLDFALMNGAASGGSTTVSLNFTAPTVAGTYTYYVQALENGVQMFSTQSTLTLTVTASSPNAISYDTNTFPATISPVQRSTSAIT